MSWQKLNIENARINMSKVVPYDASMTLLEEKQGYFHNNRLTALRRYATSGMPGYKCYKRPPKWLDGEYTSYIEINKVVEGELVHLMDISDNYYRCEIENYKGEGAKPDFYSGVIFDDTLIGQQDEWRDTTFYILGNHKFLCWNRTTNQLRLLETFQTKYEDLNRNRTVDYVGQKEDHVFFYRYYNEDGSLAGWYIFGQALYNLFEEAFDNHKGNPKDYDNRRKVGSQWAPTFSSSKKGEFNVSGYRIPYNRNQRGSNATAKFTATDTSKKLQFDNHTLMYTAFNDRGSSGDLTMLTGMILQVYKLGTSQLLYNEKTSQAGDDDWGGTFAYFIFAWHKDGYRPISETAAEFRDDNLLTAKFRICSWLHVSHDGLDSPMPKYEDSSSYYYGVSSISLNANYVSDTKQIENGFVVNYTNKQQVSLGHRYKTIARLDTQGASFLGSDSKYAYIRQNGKNYKIWIDKMFPDTPYNSEVNIIENGDLCQRVGGYKIFNTTTYYNAIYNDNPEKICCSCDDWNGRYISSSKAGEEPTLLSTSRVGHFWNSTASFDNIPAKAISSELTDQLEYAHPEYNWVNPNYTIHEGTTAYIYTAESTQIDRKLQQWEITSDGFLPVKDETKIFSHNPLYQIVPSILFCNTLKSDAVYALQVGSEVHLLKQYQYSQTTPALVYDDEATVVNIDPSARYMILQGAFYTSAGADDSIRIYNPYDTMMFEGVKTYCCDVTGLRYLGYDTTQAYYYSPATGNIYTFNGANKLNKFLEVDKREPLASGVIASGHVGIDICNIPSMNIIGMAFNDGVLLIINGQSVFIDAQNVQTLEANKELGLIKINSDYYYFGTNSLAANIGTTVADEAIELKLKTVKVGTDRLNNQTIPKHRIVVYSDTVDKDNKAEVIITLTSRLGDKIYTETHRKSLSHLDFVENEYQLEFNPKQTKSNYIQVAVSLSNADLVEYWLDINEGSEENLVRSK